MEKIDTSVSRVNYIPAVKLGGGEREGRIVSLRLLWGGGSAKRRRGRLRVIGNRKAQPTRIQIIRPFISHQARPAEPVVTRLRLIARFHSSSSSSSSTLAIRHDSFLQELVAYLFGFGRGNLGVTWKMDIFGFSFERLIIVLTY